MSLKSCLQEIMELKDPWGEAGKKLCNTWVFLDGKLEFMSQFASDNVVIIHDHKSGEKKTKEVSELKIWLPEAGIYPLQSGTWVYLEKIPKRQWLKSFSETFYRVEIFGKKEKNPLIPQIAQAKRRDIYVDKDRIMYYRMQIIGFIKNTNEVVCTNPSFNQEILDWSKNT